MTDPEHHPGRPRLWIKDMKPDDRVGGCYLVTEKRVAKTKNGKPFLSLTLADRTGEVAAKVWDEVEAFSGRFVEGDIVEVEGLLGSFRNQLQMTVSELRAKKDAVDMTLFIEAAPEDPVEMLRSLRQILNGIDDVHLKGLINRFLGDQAFITRFQEAPAAKNFHHSYMGGLLEHTLMVCRLAVEIAGFYPNLDKDLLLAGSFLHDVGKIRELAFAPQIDYTDEGRLLGHLVLGAVMVEEKLKGMKDFPGDRAVKLKHLILSHHGQYEFGSPKVPKFLEAFALNFIDDLDAKMNGLARFMERDPKEGAWTDYNRLFGRYFLKGALEAMEETSGAVDESGDPQGRLFSTDT